MFELNMYKDTGIKEKVIDEICNFARRYELKRVILFGSRARGDYKERSDIDIAFQGGSAPGFEISVDEETSTLLKFDFVNLDRPVSPELLDSINKEGIIIYEQEAGEF